MGKLSTFTPVTEEVEVSGGQTITLRGLSVNDLAGILHENANTLDALYKEHIVSESEDVPDMDVLIRALMTEAPQAVGSIIAHANDEPEMADVVTQMSGMDQIKMLLAVGRLTFHSEEELGNVVTALIQGMRAVTQTMTRFQESDALPPA